MLHQTPVRARLAGRLCGFAAGIALTLASVASGQAVAPAAPAGAANAVADVVSIQDLARIGGQGESVLRGYGLVTGLKQGDKGTDPVLARPLVEMYKANGLPLPSLASVAGAKGVAIVMLECRIPKEGARKDDQLDIYVTATQGATSLAGGRLALAPLLDPLPRDAAEDTPVWGFAFGAVEIENKAVPTTGVIRGGARIAADILMKDPGSSFTLVLDAPFRFWSVAEQVARTINGLQPEVEESEINAGLVAGPVATVIDDSTVRVEIPSSERASRARFMSEVMTAKFSPSLLKLPATVFINAAKGSIIATADVEISAVAIVHKNLTVTSILPPPVPTSINPITTTAKVTSMRTTDRPSEKARLADLLSALKQLDMPIDDQIGLLTELHQTGRLHARLIVK